MRAAVLDFAPGELAVQDVDVADPGPGEVLVRTVAAGLCHSDLHMMEAKYPTPVPIVLGHESAGVVEAVGPGVTYVQPGDHVIACLSVWCGTCESCLSGHPNMCEATATLQRPTDGTPRLSRRGETLTQFAHIGGFAEQLLLHERAVVKIDPEMPLDRAALLGCGVTTGIGAVFRTARVEPGTSVAVIGCGGIGLNVVQGARMAGARRIIAIDVNPAKLDLARTFGATHTINPQETDVLRGVRGLTGSGVDYSFEAIGLKQTVEQAFRILRPRGTATAIGMVPFGQNVEIHGAELLQEKKLQGSMMGSNRFRIDMPRYVDLYLQGRLLLDELVSARIALDEVNEGFENLKAGSVARSVIMF